MKHQTLGDLIRLRAELEEEGARLLGKVMFAFGRLEHALALFLRNIENGKYLGGPTFHARLGCFEQAVEDAHLQGRLSRDPYETWIARAQRMRQIRNELVHGRWVPDPASMTVLNVLLSADAGDQRTIAYSLSDLGKMERDVVELCGEPCARAYVPRRSATACGATPTLDLKRRFYSCAKISFIAESPLL